MKKLATTLMLATTLALGVSFTNIAKADTFQASTPATFRVAVVNVQAVLNSSSEVMALRKEQQAKLEDLKQWLQTVKADVDKQQTQEGKEKLIKKYDAQFAKRQEAVKKEYAAKLESIDKNITSVIEQERKAQGFDIVLARGIVLSGGTDITKDVAKKVK